MNAKQQPAITILAILFICLFGCACFFLIIYSDAKEKAIDDLNARQLIHAKQAQDGIEEFFDNIVCFLKSVSDSDHVVHLDHQGRRELDFAYKINFGGAIEAITRVDEKGLIIHTAPFNPDFIGRDISGQKHIQKIFATKKPTVSDVFTSIQGYRAIALHVPIVKENRFYGSIGVLIDFFSISKRYLENIRLGHTGYAWMSSEGGIELFCPVPGHTDKSVFANCKDFPSIISMAEEMVKGRSGTTVYEFDMIEGERLETIKKHAVYQPVKIADSFWTIVVASSEYELLSNLVAFRNKLIVVFIFLLSGSLLFAYYGMKSWGIVREEANRKRAEESLQALALRWQSTFDSVNDSICLLDSERNVLQANKATARMLQTQQRLFVGCKCHELVHGTSEPVVDCPFLRIKKSRRREIEEVRVGKLWLEITVDPIFKSDGSFEGAVHIMTDITERKRREEMLRQREGRLRSIFKAAPIGIGITCGRTITASNDRLCEMIGRAPEELLQQSARILYPTDEEYEYVGIEKDRQINRYGTGTVETRWRHANGDIKDILLSSTPINADDLSEGFTITALDITDRKKAEERLVAAHKMFLTVLDGIDATIYVADMDTHEILFMNKHMKETFGKDMTGEICWKAFRGEAGPCQHCTNDRLIEEDGAPGGVQVWQGQNPITMKWYMNYDRAIEWIDGRLVRIQIATDITDLKKMEEMLRQAQKMESIGNLAGGIAHDFNNILFPIVGLSEMLMEDFPRGSPEYESAREIFRAAMRGGDLVKQILAFSRQSEHRLVPVRPQQILKEVLKLSRSTIPTYIDIDHQICDRCGLIMADPIQLHQVAMNLVTNAYHAVETTGGKICVGLKESDFQREAFSGSRLESGKYALLTVSDTGVGIDPILMDKIFEPYFTTKEQGKGTGLGLAVVYGIVKEHGGEIRVRSEQGKGSTFDVYLPLIGKASRPASAERLQQNRTGSERILLVDDEEPIVRLVTQMLERLGYSVTSRLSSPEALAAFKADPYAFDLVVSDMTMPAMAGDQLVRELISVRPDIPIIICTGFSERMDVEKAKASGVRGFLMKPIVRREMAQMVRKVLDEAKSEA